MRTRDLRQTAVAIGILSLAVVSTTRSIIDVVRSPADVSPPEDARGEARSRKSVDARAWIETALRRESLQATEARRYEGSGRDIFHVPSEDPMSRRESPPVLPQPDVPRAVGMPSLPLRFYGFAQEAGATSIFLLKGQDLFVAREGDIVDRRYKIVKVMPNAVEVEDLPENRVEKLWLAQASPTF